jgi:peroxiredoxin Q/BCP
MSIRVGDKAPDFTLTSSTGEKVTLSDLRGKKTVVVFFYPKDGTPGCTAEACGFRDTHEAFVGAGAEVLGISSDSVDSHVDFASKHKLPMALLSDPGGEVRKRYGVKSTLGLLDGRMTFVVDKEGVVRHVFRSQLRATKHVSEALDVVKTL